MLINDINIGDKVIYIPEHLLMGDLDNRIKDENLGIVTSKNTEYVFVRYKDKNNSQATRADDLYSLKNREDLQKKLEVEGGKCESPRY